MIYSNKNTRCFVGDNFIKFCVIKCRKFGSCNSVGTEFLTSNEVRFDDIVNYYE